MRKSLFLIIASITVLLFCGLSQPLIAQSDFKCYAQVRQFMDLTKNKRLEAIKGHYTWIIDLDNMKVTYTENDYQTVYKILKVDSDKSKNMVTLHIDHHSIEGIILENPFESDMSILMYLVDHKHGNFFSPVYH